MTPEEQAQARMQNLASVLITAVDAEMKTNGPIHPNALLLTIAAFTSGTIDSLEIRTGQHRDTILRIYIGHLLNVVQAS